MACPYRTLIKKVSSFEYKNIFGCNANYTRKYGNREIDSNFQQKYCSRNSDENCTKCPVFR